MSVKRSSSLETLLVKSPKVKTASKDDAKLRLVLISEPELATKLSDYPALYNAGEVIKKYDGRIDAIILNGGMAQVPSKYSKRRGERFDLLEDRLKETYGVKIFKEVKGGASGSDSIDSMPEALRLARIQMRNIHEQAKSKGIPIYYIFAENDYKNVSDLITVFDKVKAYVDKNQDKEETEDGFPNMVKGVDQSLLAFVQDSYKIKASQWKNKDKGGIKDMALNMYKQWIASIFSDKDSGEDQTLKILDGREGKESTDLMTMKRFENDLEINGVKIRAMHAINGLYSGNNEAKPTERGSVMAIDNANKDALHGRLVDVYIRSHESATQFTAVDFNSRENPVYFINSGPLQSLDSQIRKHSSWNKTTNAKRVDQAEDSAMLIFSMGADSRVDLQHVGLRALKDGTDISALERAASKELYETVQISDAHVGAPSMTSSYELMEAIPLELAKSTIPKEHRYLFFLGDMLHGGSDKASWTDILWPQRGTRDELLKKLRDAKTVEEKANVLRELLDGVATPDLGRQAREADKVLISRIANYFDTAYVVDGNHVEKAAGHAGESGFLGPILEHAGTREVKYPDQVSLRNEDLTLGPYNLFMLHSPGYRGGVDAGTALAYKVIKTGNDNVQMVFAGDCHEEHAMFFAKYNNQTEKWDTFLAMTSAALQDVTSFEKKIVSKNKYTRGFEMTYLPINPEIGTSYIRHTFIPAQALRKTLDKSGGSELEKIVKLRYS